MTNLPIHNVPVFELNIGDIVRMEHLSDGHYFMDMIVAKIYANGITCHRPYLLDESNITIGIEEVWFPNDSSIKFTVLSLGDKK